jgi:hypothetical protein
MNGKGGSCDLTEAFAWRKNLGMVFQVKFKTGTSTNQIYSVMATPACSVTL